MARFSYKGRNPQGESITGMINATNSDAAVNQILNTGVTLLEIHEATEEENVFEELKEKLGIGKPTLDDIILFTRQMYTLLKSGVPIIRGMNGLASTTQNRIFSEKLEQITDNLESGRDLANSLSQHPDIFSSLYVSIIQVGESSGQLDLAFLQMAEYLELEKETRQRIKTALRYPIFVISAIVLAMFIINIYVIPQFATFFAAHSATLPLPTRMLMATSSFFVDYWPFMLALIVGAIVAFTQYVKTEAGKYKWDRLKLRLPIVGNIINRSVLARFSRSFAMALKSGVPLIQAMTVVSRAVDNDYMSDKILGMRNGVERGESLTRTANSTQMFTPLIIQMLSVGEETGMVDNMMEDIAGFYEREVDYDLKSLSSKIEPILIVFIGIMVLILALGVFLPMWDLAGTISK